MKYKYLFLVTFLLIIQTSIFSNKIKSNHELNNLFGTPAPIGVAIQVFSSSVTIASLLVDGTSILWYDNAIAGNLLSTSTVLIDGNTYYASQTIASVESVSRLAITVKNISNANQTFCNTALVSDLIATPSSNASAKWFSSVSGGIALTNASSLSTGTYYVEQSNNINQVSTLAGSGLVGNVDDSGTAASFNYPSGIVHDLNGNTFIGDYDNHKIRKIDKFGTTITFAGIGTTGFANNINPLNSSYNGPTGTCRDSSGNIYVADFINNAIRKISTTGEVSTFAGNATAGSVDGLGIAATFNGPICIAIDNSGNFYVTDYFNHKIRKISATGQVTTLAGSGTIGNANNTNGLLAQFNNPIGIAVDSQANIFVADATNNLIRKITPLGAVSTFAGSATIGFIDGDIATARFSSPIGLAFDITDNLFVADYFNHSIRKIDSNGLVTTIAGTGVVGATNGMGSVAKFNKPYALTVDSNGIIYVADTDNHLIRKIIQGYSSNRVAVNVVVNPLTSPVFPLFMSYICPGDIAPVLPSISGDGITGTWNPAIVSTTLAGTYIFTPNSGQCSTGASISFLIGQNIILNTQPQSQNIVEGQNVTFSVNATNVGVYQWQFYIPDLMVWTDLLDTFTNPDVSGSSTNTLTISGGIPADFDNLKVRVVLNNFCGSIISNEATLSVTLSKNIFENFNFTYYPNPTNGILNLEYDKEISEIEVTNILGQKLISKYPKMNKIQVDLSELSNQTYFVKVSSGSNSKIIQILKK